MATASKETITVATVTGVNLQLSLSEAVAVRQYLGQRIQQDNPDIAPTIYVMQALASIVDNL